MTSVYLHDIPLHEAQEKLQRTLEAAGLWNRLGAEIIPLDENAVGRVLAEPVWAKISSPHYHASAMDGFAVRSAATAGAQPNQPRVLICSSAAGDDRALYLDTGDPLPGWADAVIPIEAVEPLAEDGEQAQDPRSPAKILVKMGVVPWSHVRPLGEDIVATQLVLAAGHTLRPVDLGAVAACGHSELKVCCKPRVAILPTGSELVPIGRQPKSGEIIEYNSLVLAGQVQSWGGNAERFPIIPDVFEEIQAQVRAAAARSDLVLLNAGSSAGAEDFSAKVVESLGELLVHGVAVRPGHPVIIGMVRDVGGRDGKTDRQVPIIGVPGYPVSAALTAEIFVEPLLSRWLGRSAHRPVTIQAAVTRKVTSPAGDDDYMRMAVGKVGDRMLAAPLARGSGVITSLVRADGITIVGRGSQGLPAGAQVPVRLYRPLNELDETIFAIGSHDMTLDLMAQFLAERSRRLVSANVGSLGGLNAIRRGEAHFAGSHLLDPESGEYNLADIRRVLEGCPVKVVSLVEREQGLMVHKGNPRGIRTLADLAGSDVRYVNRQRGAGTRVLLDYQLRQLGISAASILGYEMEEYTHLGVAAAIASGRADCGLGIAAAAQALELDFVPLFQEQYELVIPAEFYGSELLEPLFTVLADSRFRQAVQSMPGYGTSKMGSLRAEIG